MLENFQPKAQEAAVDAIYTIERLLEEQLNEYASSVGRIQNFHDITQSFRNSGNEIFKTSPENFTEVLMLFKLSLYMKCVYRRVLIV